MNKKLFEQALAAKTPEELLKVARENGIPELTEEKAKEYFDIINHKSGVKSGELADEELDVSAGGCKTGDGKKIVTRGNVCPNWHLGWDCKTCHSFRCTCGRSEISDAAYDFGVSANFNALYVCGSCAHCDYRGGKWICTNELINARY